MTESDTIQVFVPLKLQRRNGRPKIVAPTVDAHAPIGTQDPHILKALGRAWSWRRKLESGEFATIQDIARAEKLTDRFISRMMQLAYLSPDVIDELVVSRTKPAVTLNDLIYFLRCHGDFKSNLCLMIFRERARLTVIAKIVTS